MAESKDTGHQTPWTDSDKIGREAKPGDKLEFQRSGGYKHVGIYDGDGGVYHMSGGAGVTSKSDSLYRRDEISQVAGKSKVRVNNERDAAWQPLQETEILKRAQESLGKFGGTYNAASNNCEHKANYMRYGKSESQQVINMVNGIADTFCPPYCGEHPSFLY
ncbi:phospholipase A and acyltransferase 2-like [Amphiura filiformis]|uniref:phospholipase A and acyltransferase 2-like n=1 Tax=Amphiura filiformis TaxID=82378 RepID=UPI003B21D997